MAEKEFPIKSWEDRQAGNTCRRIYCMGANAVLKEIEFAMSLSSGPEHVALEAIKQSIKNLKGDEK